MTVQISPGAPPDISGVGDYAALIARAFSDVGCQLSTVVVRQENRGDVADLPGGVTSLQDLTAEGVIRAIGQSSSVLLHFSGYGYAHWGLCYWLLQGLYKWKSAGPGRRLITLFHEVYATGPIWRASFWTSSAQKRIARDLANLSDACFVTSNGGYDQLSPITYNSPIDILPVFSNVGELVSAKVFGDRAPHGIVFGGAARRRNAYRVLRALDDSADNVFERSGITLIHDVGPPISASDTALGCDVRPYGSIAAMQVSEIMASTRFGFLDYRWDKMSKSGIGAAYAAHGVLVVNTNTEPRATKGLVEGEHFIDAKRWMNGGFDAETTAQAGWTRYQQHGLSSTVESLLVVLQG